MKFIVKYILNSRNGSMLIHVPLRLFYNGLQKGATMDANAYGFYNKFLYVAAFFSATIIYDEYSNSNPLTDSFILISILGITFILFLIRYGFNHRAEIPISDDMGKFVSQPYMVKIANFVLASRQKSFLIRIFCKPFYNSIKKGASMEEEHYYKAKSFVILTFGLILLIGSIAIFERPEPLAYILVAFFTLGFFNLFTMFYGYTHRAQIELTDDVAPFSAKVAFSGGAWGIAGLALLSLFNLIYQEWNFILDSIFNLFN